MIVRRRFGIVFGLLTAVSLGSSSLALYELAQIQHNVNRIVNGNNVGIKLHNDLSESVHVVSRVIPKLVLLHDVAEIEVEVRKIANARRRYDDAWTTLQTMSFGESGQLADVFAASQRARPLNDRVVALARSTTGDGEALALLRAQAAPATQAWQDALDHSTAFGEADNATRFVAAENDYRDARSWLFGINLLNVAMGVTFGWLMLRQRRGDAAVQAELARSRDAADSAARAKSSFLANMSHEIRTPMSGVLGITELLSRTPLDAAQRKHLQIIRRSGHALMALLNGILDLSRVESGRLTIERQAIDLRQVLQACVDLMQPSAADKGLALGLTIDANLPTWVIGDALRLQQVVDNLLGNAIKFTSAGTVRLSARADAAAGAGHCRICVEDTGPGVDAQTASRLLQPFSPGDDGVARNHGLSGLGLMIAKQLVEAMGGTLTLATTSDAGSTFCLTLYLPPAPGAARHAADAHAQADALNASAAAALQSLSATGDPQQAEPSVSARRLTVLLAEDNPVNQLYCQALLEQMGHAVHLANDGQEAVGMAAHRGYDLILMDCQMPVVDGFDATRRIRQAELQQGARRRPIVAVTATVTGNDQQRCRDAGMDDVLSKPFSREQLERLLRQAVPAG